MRIRPKITPSIVISTLALFVALGGTGYAASGGNFILGASNRANKTTVLKATPANGAGLAITNSNPGPAAAFKVSSGIAPFSVNSATKVKNLNADQLDGIDSNGFIKGSGKALGYAAAPGANDEAGVTFGQWELGFECPHNPLSDSGTLLFFNDGSVTNLFADSGANNPNYYSIATGTGMSFPTVASGDSWTFRVQSFGHVATIEVATLGRPSTCHFQAQALITQG